MIAIPITSMGDNPSLSQYFGKSKWFAFFDEGSISFEKNILQNGCSIADWLYDLGVTKTVINHIGQNPLEKLKDLEIDCLTTHTAHNTLTEVLRNIENDQLITINDENKMEVIDLVNGCKESC